MHNPVPGLFAIVALLLVLPQLVPFGGASASSRAQARPAPGNGAQLMELEGYLIEVGSSFALRTQPGPTYLLRSDAPDSTRWQPGMKTRITFQSSAPPFPGDTLVVHSVHVLSQPSRRRSMQQKPGKGGGSEGDSAQEVQGYPPSLPPLSGTESLEQSKTSDEPHTWSEFYANPELFVSELSTLVVVVSMCKQAAAIRPEDLDGIMFGSKVSIGGNSNISSRYGDVNLKDYFTTCSYGNAIFDRTNSAVAPLLDYFTACSYGNAIFNRKNSAVAPLLVKLPCSGFSPIFGSWSASSCEFNDYLGWVEAAMDAAAEEQGFDLSLYRHRVVVLPAGLASWAGSKCRWAGLGTVGPAAIKNDGSYDYGYVWINGDNAASIQAYFHEIGHNLYLGHAGKYNSESCTTCDWSCAMGMCCRVRCFNSVHNWNLGWASPTQGHVIEKSNISPGNTLSFSIPSQSTQERNMLVTANDWVIERTLGAVAPWPFEESAYDKDIPSSFAGGVLIHAWNGTGQRDSATVSQHVATLSDSTMWKDTLYGSQLVIKQLKSSLQFAELTVCLIQENSREFLACYFFIPTDKVTGIKIVKSCELDCSDGLDNDCNGLIDEEDPSCYMGCPEPPPPKTPPRPGMPGWPYWPDFPGLPPPGTPRRPPPSLPSIPSPPVRPSNWPKHPSPPRPSKPNWPNWPNWPGFPPYLPYEPAVPSMRMLPTPPGLPSFPFFPTFPSRTGSPRAPQPMPVETPPPPPSPVKNQPPSPKPVETPPPPPSPVKKQPPSPKAGKNQPPPPKAVRKDPPSPEAVKKPPPGVRPSPLKSEDWTLPRQSPKLQPPVYGADMPYAEVPADNNHPPHLDLHVLPPDVLWPPPYATEDGYEPEVGDTGLPTEYPLAMMTVPPPEATKDGYEPELGDTGLPTKYPLAMMTAPPPYATKDGYIPEVGETGLPIEYPLAMETIPPPYATKDGYEPEVGDTGLPTEYPLAMETVPPPKTQKAPPQQYKPPPDMDSTLTFPPQPSAEQQYEPPPDLNGTLATPLEPNAKQQYEPSPDLNGTLAYPPQPRAEQQDEPPPGLTVTLASPPQPNEEEQDEPPPDLTVTLASPQQPRAEQQDEPPPYLNGALAIPPQPNAEEKDEPPPDMTGALAFPPQPNAEQQYEPPPDLTGPLAFPPQPNAEQQDEPPSDLTGSLSSPDLSNIKTGDSALDVTLPGLLVVFQSTSHSLDCLMSFSRRHTP
eukprot:gene27134-2363_t